MSEASETSFSLTLLTRHDCGLCEDMQRAIAEWDAGRRCVRLDVVDIDGDPTLLARHGERIPVLLHRDRELCHGRLADGVLDAALAAAAAD